MNKQVYIMTYGEVIEVIRGINLFLQQNLPVMVSLDTARAKRVLQEHHSDYQEALRSARKQYIKLNKDGSAKSDDNNQVIFKSDKAREEFTEALNKIKDKEIEVELTDPPTKEQIIEVFEHKKESQIKGAIIDSLIPLLEPKTKKSK